MICINCGDTITLEEITDIVWNPKTQREEPGTVQQHWIHAETGTVFCKDVPSAHATPAEEIP